MLTNNDQAVHVREAILPAPLGDEIAIQLQESQVQPIEMDEVPNPRKLSHRIYGKQRDSNQPRVVLPAEVPGLKDPLPNSGLAAAAEALTYSPSLAPDEDPLDAGVLELPPCNDGGEPLGDLDFRAPVSSCALGSELPLGENAESLGVLDTPLGDDPLQKSLEVPDWVGDSIIRRAQREEIQRLGM